MYFPNPRLQAIGLLCLILGLAAAAPLRADVAPVAVPATQPSPTTAPAQLPPLTYPGYFKPIDKAQMQSSLGRYRLSLQTLKTIKQADPTQVALIKAKSLAALGQKTEAVAALSDPAVANQPAVQVLRARTLAQMGRLDEAIALLKTHLQQHPASIAGHYSLGEIDEQAGDMKNALAQYDWFVTPPQSYLEKWRGQSIPFNNAEEVVLIGRALDRHSAMTGAYQKDPGLHNMILNMFVKAYDVIDRAYWPAHTAAAEYYLSHNMSAEAAQELKQALSSNPRDERSLALMGQLTLEQFNFDGTEKIIAAIRQTDPSSVPANLLEVRNLLLQRKPQEAEKTVQSILKRQPQNLEALGLLAGSQALQLKESQMRQTLDRVEKTDPDNASAYLEVAEQLAAARQYPRAEAMYKIAIKRQPWWTVAQNGLGLLYTQSGDEDAARVTLDHAHALDPFNYLTTNYLRLLDRMASMSQLKTAHFVILYDEKTDPLVPLYFGDYLEKIYSAVGGDFQHYPSAPTRIEVFARHDEFSVRTAGSPWIGTVGACTGRVIALTAPRKGGDTLGTFNWADVLRHEFTHTITLGATDNRIPLWFTEGLAVYEEQMPLRWEWVPMLYQAVHEHQLFTLENLTWGFVRPKKPMDHQLAYAEAFWICKYIEQTYGHQAILQLLEQFKAGKTVAAAFESALNQSPDAFTRNFFAWTEKQSAAWGYDPMTTQLYDLISKNAQDLIKQRSYKKAAEQWEQAAILRPMDALPHARLAALYLTPQLNEPEKALPHWQALSRVELKDNRYARRTAELCEQMGKWDEAIQSAMRAIHINPQDLTAHQLLADIYEKKGGHEKDLAREKQAIKILQQQETAHNETG